MYGCMYDCMTFREFRNLGMEVRNLIALLREISNYPKPILPFEITFFAAYQLEDHFRFRVLLEVIKRPVISFLVEVYLSILRFEVNEQLETDNQYEEL